MPCFVAALAASVFNLRDDVGLERNGMAMRYSHFCLGPESMSPQEKALYSKGEVYNTVSRASAVTEA
jgi:hypothetical protein